MVPIDEVRARTQKDELRDFRTYVIERGAATCLVKLYMHLMEKQKCNEPVDLEVVKEFLAGFKDESNPHAVEISSLEEENAILRDQAGQQEEKVAALEQEIDFWKRKRLGWRYWKLFQFRWADRDSLSGTEIWASFCGDCVDPNTEVQPAQKVAPPFCSEEYPGPNLGSAKSISRAAFTRWMATEAPEEVLGFLMDMVHLFEERVGEGVAPFQETIMESFCCATHYPVCPNPDKKMVEVIASLPGSKDKIDSEQSRAWDVFESDVLKSLSEVKAPVAYPVLLLELFAQLNDRFGCEGDPPPLTEEEQAELDLWEPRSGNPAGEQQEQEDA